MNMIDKYLIILVILGLVKFNCFLKNNGEDSVFLYTQAGFRGGKCTSHTEPAKTFDGSCSIEGCCTSDVMNMVNNKQIVGLQKVPMHQSKWKGSKMQC